MIHGARVSPSRKSVSEIRLATAIASGFGSVLPTLGARTAASAPTLPFPLRSRKRANERAPASTRMSERVLRPSPRRAAMKARTSAGVSLANCLRVGAPPRWRARKPRNWRASRPYAPSQRAISAVTSGLAASSLMTARVASLPSPFLKPPESARPTIMTARIVDVLVPVALDQTYSYRVPEGLALAPGDLVAVPLGARGETMGVVWADNPSPNPRLHNRMKDVVGKHDMPPLKTELRKFVDWVADYTLSPRGTVLRMALRMGEHLGPARERVAVRLAGPPPASCAPARARVIALFADKLARAKGDAAHEAGVSVGVIDGLIDEGTLATLVLPPEPVTRTPDPDFRKPEFSLGQLAAADALRTIVDQGGYTVSLLDGVTGSGKTEVYFEAVAENIRHGRQTLILMPEISLTSQSLDRFTARFGVRPAEWHSQLSPRTRARRELRMPFRRPHAEA